MASSQYPVGAGNNKNNPNRATWKMMPMNVFKYSTLTLEHQHRLKLR